MKCPHCMFEMADDCRYCPQCGQPTRIAEESQTLAFSPESAIAAAARAAVAEAKAAPAASAVAANAAPPADLSGELLSEPVIHALLTRANLSRLRGNWSDAIDRCVTVLRSDPSNHTAHSLLGDIYRDQGKLDDAIQWYRMALDLHPNPADEAKLRQQERERARLLSASAWQSPAAPGRRNPLPALSSDSSLFAGTAALLGLSPRRWLSGMTIASVVFLALMMLALIGFQSKRRPAASPSTATMPPAVSANSANSLLPPPNPNAPAPATTPPPVNSVPINSSGKGFPADDSGSATPNSANHARAPKRDASELALNLPLAPIKEVVPLVDDSHVAVIGGAEIYTPRPVTEDVPLEAGMRITDVQSAPDNGSAQIVITAFSSQAARGPLIRNTYRAARAVFDADTRLTYANVRIQPAPGIAGDASPLLVAEIDRFAAMQFNPNRDSLERLASYLHILSEVGQANTPLFYSQAADSSLSPSYQTLDPQMQ